MKPAGFLEGAAGAKLVMLAVGIALIACGAQALAEPYIYDAYIDDFSGVDSDYDGYYNTFSFNVYIDADTGTTGYATVAAWIWCTTTGEGFQVEPWTIHADDPVYIAVSFADSEFTIPLNSSLDFEVELWNESFTAYYGTLSDLGPNEPIPADGSSGGDPFIYSADLVVDTAVDADGDGYAESFSFDLEIDADTAPGSSAEVAALITCTTTDDFWSTTSWPISGDDLDPESISFTEEDFDLADAADLQFRVELYDADLITKYDEGNIAATFKAEPPGCPVSVASAALGNIGSVVDSDADGYFEEFDFDIVIDVEAPGCSRSVTAKIICDQTGREWTSSPFTVTNTGPQDAATISFDYSEFALSAQTELTFTAQIFDAAGATAISPSIAVAGSQLKAEPAPFTGTLSVQGRVMYKDNNGTPQPLRYAKVEIWERTLKRAGTVTDGNGYYQRTLSVVRPGSLYIRAFAESAATAYPACGHEITRIVTPATGTTYRAESAVASYTGNKITIDLVIDNTGPNAGAFCVYDAIIEGYHRVRTWLNDDVPAVNVVWPDDKTYFDGTTIHVIELDRWDRDVVMHEYGHYVAWEFGFLGSEGGDHSWDADCRLAPGRTTQEAARLAYDEGWATFFSVAAQYSQTGDSAYNDSEDQVIARDLETDTAMHFSPGEYYESMIACSLWDAFDNHNDPADDQDLLQAPVAKIWSAMTSQAHTMANFWANWQTIAGYRIQMHRILRDHEMSFLPDDCTIRVIADSPGARFVLTEAASEPIEGTVPATFSGMPPGTYSISWLPAGDLAAPGDSSQAVSSGSTFTFSGTYLPSDIQPPAPNAFERITATGTASLSMTSKQATDETGPVSYRIEGQFFDGSQWTSGGGINEYGWSTTRPNNWTDTSLLENGYYRYLHYVRDSAATPNISSAAPASVATLLGPPADSELAITNVTATSATVSVAEPPKPSGAGQTAAYFDIITGEDIGPGAADRDFADSYAVQYQDLQPNTRYGWRVRYRGYNGYLSAFNPNEKIICTPAAVPGAPTAATASSVTVALALDANGNPTSTEFAIACSQTSPADDAWNQKWIDKNGNPSGEPAWQTAAHWATVSVKNLMPQTTYRLEVTARNRQGVETAPGPAATITTSIPGDANGDCKVNIIDLIRIRNYLNRSPDSDNNAAAADLNGDGKVNIIDLIKCRNNLSNRCPD